MRKQNSAKSKGFNKRYSENSDFRNNQKNSKIKSRKNQDKLRRMYVTNLEKQKTKIWKKSKDILKI